jgi:hypothetical protein
MKTFAGAASAALLALAAASLAAAQTPSPDPSAPPNAAIKSGGAGAQPLAKGHNSFTKSEAKSRIEKAGFTNVTGLALDSDGLWQATASRDGQSLHVALDYKGDVAAE